MFTRRVVVLDELRLIELEPAPGAEPWIRAGLNTLAWASASGAVVLAAHGGYWYLLGAPLLFGARNFFRAKDASPLGRSIRRCAMRVGPWGIVVDPQGEREILPWAKIDALKHRAVWLKEGLTVDLVSIEVAGRVLLGARRAAMSVASLSVVFPGYLATSRRRLALDLKGVASIESERATFAELYARARRLVESPEGASQLGLPSAGYRGAVQRVAGREALYELQFALEENKPDVDEGPFAAIVAAMLDARDLIPFLLPLCMSPNALVAAIGKASALRLGATPMQPGAVNEVFPFLLEPEIAALERFSRGEDVL